MQAFPSTDDTRTVEDIDRHIKRANMRPAAMTDEQAFDLIRETHGKGAMPSDILTLRAVESARDDQWLAMLGVEPVAHIVELPSEYSGLTKFFTAPSDPRGFPVYTTPQPDRVAALEAAVSDRDDAIAAMRQTRNEMQANLRRSDERVADLEAKVAELRAVCKKAFDDLGVLVERNSSEETITITVKTADIAAARTALSDLAQAGEGE